MNEPCRHEPDVLRAAEEDRWTDSLRRHLGECDECMAAASVSPWMHRFSRMSDRDHILPDPSIVWLKARVLASSSDAARASRPLTIAQITAYLVVAGGWATLLTWKWKAVETWLRSFTPTGLVESAARADLSMSFFALIFILASMTVMLALHTIMAEE